MNVKRNMLKEQEMDGKGEGDDNYHTASKGPSKDKMGGNTNNQGNNKGDSKAGDINLTDRNLVLNFAEEGEEEQNDASKTS